jgi:sugar porter (SP) family MFS transporter
VKQIRRQVRKCGPAAHYPARQYPLATRAPAYETRLPRVGAAGRACRAHEALVGRWEPLAAIEQLSITLGILLASVANALLYRFAAGAGDAQWRAALAAQSVPGVLLLAAVAPLPRSPRWLAAQGRRAEAAASLAALRGVPPDSGPVAAELADIEAEMRRDAAAAAAGAAGLPAGAGGGRRLAALLCSARVRRPLLLAVLLQVCQQATGINIGLYYSAALWERLGIDKSLAATWLVVANAGVLVLATLPGLALLEAPRVGRRRLLIGGGVAMALCHAAVAASVSAAEGGSASAPAFAWVGVATMMAFVAAFSATWGPTVWVLQSELLPLDARAVGGACATVANWASNAVIGKAAPYALAAWGPRTYAVFSVACAAMAAYVAVALPETAGVPLEDISALFVRRGDPPAAHKAVVEAASAALVEGGGVATAAGEREALAGEGRAGPAGRLACSPRLGPAPSL